MPFMNILYVLLLTITPGIELRVSIPVGILLLGLDPLLVFVMAVTANLLIIWPMFILLDFFWHKFARYKIVRNTVEKIWDKSHHKVHKHGYIALTLMVGIPLPLTGAHAGTLLAWLMNLERKKAFMAIALGVIIASILVTAITVGAIEGAKWVIEQP